MAIPDNYSRFTVLVKNALRGEQNAVIRSCFENGFLGIFHPWSLGG
jgi:hypothetical protein